MATTLLDAVNLINESLRTLGYSQQLSTTATETQTAEQVMTAELEKLGVYPQDQYNAIMKQMNLILQQRNFFVMFDATRNKFRQWLVDMTENGFGIEDLMHGVLEPLIPLWDNNTRIEGTPHWEEVCKDLYERAEEKTYKAFHISPMPAEFKTTVDRRNYQKVFTAYGVTRYIDTKLANLQTSAEIWLMQEAVGLVQSMISNNEIQTVFSQDFNPNTENGVTSIVEEIRTLMAGFKTPSSLFNKGVWDENTNTYQPILNMTDTEDDIFLIISPELYERFRVRGYSNAFNLADYQVNGRILFVPAGTDLGSITSPVDGTSKKVLAVVADRRTFLLGLRHWDATTKFIENTLETNHFLLIDGIKGYNTFMNAVAICGDSVDDYIPNNGVEYGTVIADNVNSDFFNSFRVNGEKPERSFATFNPTDTSIEFIVPLKSTNFVEFNVPTGDYYLVKVDGQNVGSVENDVQLEFGKFTTLSISKDIS